MSAQSTLSRDDSSISGMVDLIRHFDEVPQTQPMCLHTNRESIRMTLMKDALNDAGITKETSGPIKQHYFAGAGLIVINLNGGAADE